MRRAQGHRQRGAAIVTALLLTTLAVTIVTSLFWQQQVQIRAIENQRLQLQKQWILRGALDWARLILSEDARHSSEDHLGEPWNIPLAPTSLAQYVEGEAQADASETLLSGRISDAQARFNLSNLSRARVIDARAVATFERLLGLLDLDPALAMSTARTIAASQNPAVDDGGVTHAEGLTMPLLRETDLLAVPGMDAAAVHRLKDYVVILPRPTPVNLNTASAIVIAACVEGLSPAAAAALIAVRERQPFRSQPDLLQNLPLRNAATPYQLSADAIAFRTSFFFVDGRIALGRAALGMRALLRRDGTQVRVIAIDES